MTNPFMARTKPGTATVETGRAAEDAPRAGNAADTPSRTQLKKLDRPDLVELARARGLDTDGTKAELIERLLA